MGMYMENFSAHGAEFSTIVRKFVSLVNQITYYNNYELFIDRLLCTLYIRLNVEGKLIRESEFGKLLESEVTPSIFL
jgi:hypothetical protein